MRALALKYRPKTLNDVVEQIAIVQILQQQLKTNTHQSCYLFTGAPGVGKTSIARIFANELNEGNGTPIEIDAASNNGVDDVREIISNVAFKALDSKYKVYILDEVHQFSLGAWNAMLKLIEEPPAHAVFILCTTQPEKVPETIISRVQRFDFRRITYNSIIDRLRYIIDSEEDVSATDDALAMIARLAEGGLRDAITLLDKCLSYSDVLDIDAVSTALGTVNYKTMFDLLEFIYNKQIKEALIVIDDVYRSGVDLKQFVKRFCYFLSDSCKYVLTRDFEYIQIPQIYEDRLAEIAVDYDFVLVMMLDVQDLSAAIKWETNSKYLIEAKLIEWCY